MLLEISLYGMGTAILKALKVALWVGCSTVVVLLINQATQAVSDFGTSHPLYIAYTGVAVMLINSFGVWAKTWLTSVRPTGAPAPDGLSLSEVHG